jgi:hypothetical protein
VLGKARVKDSHHPWRLGFEPGILGGQFVGTLESVIHSKEISGPSVKLELWWVQFVGSIPESLATLPIFRVADLGYNNLTGNFPLGWRCVPL